METVVVTCITTLLCAIGGWLFAVLAGFGFSILHRSFTVCLDKWRKRESFSDGLEAVWHNLGIGCFVGFGVLILGLVGLAGVTIDDSCSQAERVVLLISFSVVLFIAGRRSESADTSK